MCDSRAVTVEAAWSDAPAPVDAWRRGWIALNRWAAAHVVLVSRVRRVRVALVWLGLLVIAVVLISQPEVREAAGVYLVVYYLLIGWFLLARTKTLSWRFVSFWFTGSLLWSLVIVKVTSTLALAATQTHVGSVTIGGNVRADGPSIAIAGVGEECLKLFPLAIAGLVAARRLPRLAVVDVALLGLTSGLAFQAVEDPLRRIAAAVTRPGLLQILDMDDPRGPTTGYPQYSLSPVSGWSSIQDGQASFPGHHVTTGLVATALGLGLWAWREKWSGWRKPLLRSLGVLLPLVTLWVAIGVHAGNNAAASIAGARWASSPRMPWLVRSGWWIGMHGRHLGAILLLFGLLALLADAYRRWTADRALSLAVTSPIPVVRLEQPPPTVTSTASLRTVLGALTHYTGSDWLRQLRAHARHPQESIGMALSRGRAAAGRLRAERGDAMQFGASENRPARIRTRIVSGTLAAALLAAVLLLAPAWARQIGPSLILHLNGWLAGLFDALGKWWDSEPVWAQFLEIAGVAALIALSGGSFALALWGAGGLAYLAEHGQGEAALIRDPKKAVANYVATTTPQAAALDLLEAVLTLWPAGVGARFGTELRAGMKVAGRRRAEQMIQQAEAAARAHAGEVTRVGPPLEVASGQFGKKLGRHFGDYGLDPSDPAAREWLRRHIGEIWSHPDEVKRGRWNPRGGGGCEYLFHRLGRDVVVGKADGTFVTILKDGIDNGWFKAANRL